MELRFQAAVVYGSRTLLKHSERKRSLLKEQKRRHARALGALMVEANRVDTTKTHNPIISPLESIGLFFSLSEMR